MKDWMDYACLIAALLAIILMSTGCVTAHATLPDGTQLSYSRLGNQEIGSFGWDSESKVFYFDRQKSETEIFEAIARGVAEGLK